MTAQAERIRKLQQKALQRRQRQQQALDRIAERDRAERIEELRQTGIGARLVEFVAALRIKPMDKWAFMVAAQDWLLEAPMRLRAEALLLINHAYGRACADAGIDPLNDPLPGEPDTPWTAIHSLLSTPEPAREGPRAARDVPPGTSRAFTEHRTMAEVMAAEPGLPRKKGIIEMQTLSHAPVAPVQVILNITGPADVETVRSLLPGIFGGQPATVPTAPASEPSAAETKRTRAKKTDAEPAAPAPADDSKGPVYSVVNGGDTANFAAPEQAVDLMLGCIGDATSVDELDAFLAANEGCINDLPAASRDKVTAAAKAQRDKVAAPDKQVEQTSATQTASAGEPPTPEAVLAALQEFAKSKGPLALKALLTEFGAAKFGDLKPDQFAAVMAKVGA